MAGTILQKKVTATSLKNISKLERIYYERAKDGSMAERIFSYVLKNGILTNGKNGPFLKITPIYRVKIYPPTNRPDLKPYGETFTEGVGIEWKSLSELAQLVNSMTSLEDYNTWRPNGRGREFKNLVKIYPKN